MKKASILIQEFKSNKYDNKLIDIYVDQQMIPYQKQRYIRALESFIELYSDQEVSIFSAPGRSEICGNHTDHQRGRVLAAAINLDIIGIVAKDEHHIKVVSDDYDINVIDIHDCQMKEEEKGSSESLIKGVVAKCQALGHHIGGFKGYFTSDVLIGSGLSSSAAFEVLIGTILSGLYNEMKINPITIGQIGQYAENEYFGKPCGLMDQCASAVGSLIYIDFKDSKSPMVKKLDVDFSQYKHSLCIVDTKGSHADLTNDYAAIPAEMKSVAQVYNQQFLGDVDESKFYESIASIKETCDDRSILRAMHFFEENNRVLEAVDALQKNQFEDFKDIVLRSGNSSFKYLQNVYTNTSVKCQSVSLALALSEKILHHNGVSRVHGGGFAGTIQSFVADQYVETYKREIEKVTGVGTCHVLKIRKHGGIQVL